MSLRCPIALAFSVLVIFWLPMALETATAADSPKVIGAERREKLKQVHQLSREVNKLRDDGKLSEAIESAEKMVAIQQEVLGLNHKEVANAYRRLSILHEDSGHFPEARKAREQVLQIDTKLHGKDSWQVADARFELQNVDLLAKLTAKQRIKLREAERLVPRQRALSFLDRSAERVAQFHLALAIRKEVLGEKHPDTIDTYGQLGHLHWKRGEYAKSEGYFRQVLALRQELLGAKHPQCANNLTYIGDLLIMQGELNKAEAPLQQALVVRRESLGEKHPAYAHTLRSLGNYYVLRRNFDKAEAMVQQALVIHKKTRGEKNPETIRDLSMLARVYWKKGDYAKAEEYCLQALPLRKEAVGDKHPEFANGLNLLALIYLSQKDADKAEPPILQALVIRKKALGEKHPEYARSLNNLARVHELRKEYAKAEPLDRQAAVIILEHLEQSADDQNEQAQMSQASAWRWTLDDYLHTAEQTKSPAEAGYSLVLSWKGAITARQRLARLARATQKADPETLRVFQELEKVSSELSRLSLKGGGEERTEEEETETAARAEDEDLPKKIQQLCAQREKLEVELSRRTADFRRFHESRTLTPAKLQKLLPEGTVLVDFLEYGKKDRRLLAFVVSKDRVERVDLGEAVSLFAAVDSFRSSVARRTQAVVGKDDPALTLRKKVWEPLEKHLRGAKLVLVSPDGPLSQLPFAALPGKQQDKFLLEELALVVLPVPRMLPELLAPRSPERDKTPPSLLALGDVDFDANSPEKQPPQEEESTWKRRRAGEPMKWNRLPGTRGEVLAIEETFHKAVPKGKLTTLRDKQATESALRKLAPQHEYLHLATHGFFAPREVRSATQNDASDNARTGSGELAVGGSHPGLLSGIALAGANKPAEDDDGVLTALEVAEMDLSKVELAVLSACETGLGEVAGGEGVLGLQRAFQVAGARSTVTSFWKVDDQATRNLMERFYDNYWKRGMGAQEALREAQLVMLREGVKRGMVREEEGLKKESRTPPYYWAAFVLSGDWR